MLSPTASLQTDETERGAYIRVAWHPSPLSCQGCPVFRHSSSVHCGKVCPCRERTCTVEGTVQYQVKVVGAQLWLEGQAMSANPAFSAGKEVPSVPVEGAAPRARRKAGRLGRAEKHRRRREHQRSSAGTGRGVHRRSWRTGCGRPRRASRAERASLNFVG